MAERRKLILQRLAVLENERASWLGTYREVTDYVLPRNGRYTTTDRNKGDRRGRNIIDSTGTFAARTLAAALMAGASSPARPWFQLTLPDPARARAHRSRMWLDHVTQLMRSVYTASNTYRALHQCYEEIVGFGTAADIVVPDYETVLHHHPLTAGEYFASHDARGQPNTLYRRFAMTAGQVAQQFGAAACSEHVQRLLTQKLYDEWVDIVHAIEPRDFEAGGPGLTAQRMQWRSCYVELQGGGDDTVLRESGFDYFPALVPRWSVVGSDIYGWSPVMDTLGDIKQLQHQQLRKGQGIDYQVHPAKEAPPELSGREHKMLPGETVYHSRAGGTTGIRPIWEVRMDLNHMHVDILDVRDRIRRGLHVDLILLLTSSDGSDRTAREIRELHEEKMLVLGPVLERLHNELLRPLITITFEQLRAANLLPPPPPELEGETLEVEFVSALAQAQRAVGIGTVDRWVANIGALSDRRPDALDRLDVDGYVDESAHMLGVPAKLIVPIEDANRMRAARAQAQKAKEQSEMLAQQAGAAKDLSTVPADDGSLANALAAVTGYGGAP